MLHKRVVIISPLRGDYARNHRYALLCAKDCIQRGESPFASHLFYPLFLDDQLPDDRFAGMNAGRDWMEAAQVIAVYTDLGISEGMKGDIEFAQKRKMIPQYRTLNKELMDVLREIYGVSSRNT